MGLRPTCPKAMMDLPSLKRQQDLQEVGIILKIINERSLKMEFISKELKNLMIYLRISGIDPTLPKRISYAKAKKLSYEEFLELVLSDEFERKEARALNIKINKAGVANLESYSWDTTIQYDRELVKKLFSLSFIEKKQSVLLFGPTGTGKTTLARHLAFAALKAGHSVLFTRADKMFKGLKLSTLDGDHNRTLRYYLKYDLLVVDDFAIRPFSCDEADNLYVLVIERYETKSSIFTSARAP